MLRQNQLLGLIVAAAIVVVTTASVNAQTRGSPQSLVSDPFAVTGGDWDTSTVQTDSFDNQSGNVSTVTSESSVIQLENGDRFVRLNDGTLMRIVENAVTPQTIVSTPYGVTHVQRRHRNEISNIISSANDAKKDAGLLPWPGGVNYVHDGSSTEVIDTATQVELAHQRAELANARLREAHNNAGIALVQSQVAYNEHYRQTKMQVNSDGARNFSSAVDYEIWARDHQKNVGQPIRDVAAIGTVIAGGVEFFGGVDKGFGRQFARTAGLAVKMTHAKNAKIPKNISGFNSKLAFKPI